MKIVLRCFCCLMLAAVAAAQPNCPLPPAVEKASRALTIFSDEQEADLGDLMAERFSADLPVVHNDALTRRLKQIGDQLVSYLPPNHFRFQFFLIEYPSVNAFSISGGRVYITRKIIALAKSDDELAGIMAHELGHIVTHQTGIEMTRRLREVLGVTSVGDRDDIREKYFRYLDNVGRRPGRRDTGEDGEDQLIADQVAVFAMARAGFSPHAYVDIWDRFQQTHGQTGSWLSDFFLVSKPSQKRLRDMMKSLSALPPGCAQVRPPADEAGFAKWQSEVVNFRADTLEESLPGLVFKQKLALPLRPDLNNLKFSPDGKYILAQDEGGIQVLSRDPFAVLFFIDAADAENAFFTPDSKSVAFYNNSLRVEIWDIASQHNVSVREMTLNRSCLQTLLSPDAAYLACLRYDLSLELLEVTSGQVIAQKKNFVEIYDQWSYILIQRAVHEHQAEYSHLAFSPDGRYFLAGSMQTEFAYDLQLKKPLTLPAKIRALLRYSFTFLGPDRLVGVNLYEPGKSAVLQFPSGSQLYLLPQLKQPIRVGSPAHGNFVMLWPLQDRPRAALNLDNTKLIIRFEYDTGDVYDNWVIGERRDGRLALVDSSQQKEVASVQLNQSPLGELDAASVSSELKWLAVSSHSRGAVFDLVANTRLYHTHSFQGAWFSEDDVLYADFPKFDKEERKILRVDLSATGSHMTVEELKDSVAFFSGSYLLEQKPKDGKFWDPKDWTYEIRDYRTHKTVWTRHFPGEAPDIQMSPSKSAALLIWPLSTAAARDELQRFPQLKPNAEKEDLLIELLDFRKDAIVGNLLVKTNRNPITIKAISFDQDWLALVLKDDRVLLYSLATGEQKGHFFGQDVSVNADADAIAISNSSSRLQIFNLSDAQLRREYQFSSAVAYKSFSPDGHRLFAFTRDQTAYTLDLSIAH